MPAGGREGEGAGLEGNGTRGHDSDAIRCAAFDRGRHLDAVLALCAAEGWASDASEPDRAAAAFTAPGVVALVAVAAGRVVGFVQAQGDGGIGSHLSLLVVDPPFRHRGIGRRLVEAAFRRTGTRRMDVWTDDAQAAAFYQTLPHRRGFGLRLYPGRPDAPGGPSAR